MVSSKVFVCLSLPDKTVSSMRLIRFLVRMSLTSLVILTKLPFWISVIRLLVKLTLSNLGWVSKARVVSLSRGKIFRIILEKFIIQWFKILNTKAISDKISQIVYKSGEKFMLCWPRKKTLFRLKFDKTNGLEIFPCHRASISTHSHDSICHAVTVQKKLSSPPTRQTSQKKCRDSQVSPPPPSALHLIRKNGLLQLSLTWMDSI